MINFQQVKIDLAFETWVTRDSSKIAFSRQELFQVFLKMWLTRNFDNETLTGIGRYQNVDSRFYHICKNLVSRKILFGFNKTTKGYSFFIKNTSKTFTLEQLTCAIYPYGYLSFLSAMNIYQLSEIKSSAVYYVTYDRTHWKQLAIKEFFQNFKTIISCSFTFYFSIYNIFSSVFIIFTNGIFICSFIYCCLEYV